MWILEAFHSQITPPRRRRSPGVRAASGCHGDALPALHEKLLFRSSPGRPSASAAPLSSERRNTTTLNQPGPTLAGNRTRIWFNRLVFSTDRSFTEERSTSGPGGSIRAFLMFLCSDSVQNPEASAEVGPAANLSHVREIPSFSSAFQTDVFQPD